MGMCLRPIQRLCETTGCAVLLVHHCRRDAADAYRPGRLSDIAWSGFGQFSEQWIMLSRRRACDPQTGNHELWLSCGGRAGHASVWAVDIEDGTTPTPPDAPFAESSESSNPKSKIQNSKSPGPEVDRRWCVTVLQPQRARAQADRRDQIVREQRRDRRMSAVGHRDRRLTLDLLQRYPQGETASILRDVLGFSGSRMTRVLTGLTQAGLVETTPPIGGRRGAIGYRLATSQPGVEIPSTLNGGLPTSDFGPRTSDDLVGPDRTPITHPGGEVVQLEARECH